MAYIDKHGVEFSNDRKTLLKCPKDYHGEYVIPDTTIHIGNGAFESCTGLISVTIPDSVKTVGGSAFYGCSGLSSIAIPNSIADIGGYAFNGCSSLASIIIPNKIWRIGECVFGECTSLTSVVIPDSVIHIGEKVFYNCHSLNFIEIPNSVRSIGHDAFRGCISLPVFDNIRYADTYLVEVVDTSLITYKIKEGTRFIGEFAFSRCSNLQSIIIPNSVTSIGRCAFEFFSISGRCSLKSVTIPSNVRYIGAYAFAGCHSLLSVTILSNDIKIEVMAFSDCSGLQQIIVPADKKEYFIQMAGLKGFESFCVEQGEVINERATINRLLHKNNITCFYHFTSRRNLESIRKHGGLYSWLYLTKHEITIPVQGGGELSRNLDQYNGIADYVHLSFCESHPMAYRHRQDGVDIVVLKISTEVALWNNTKFSDMNAVDSQCRCEQGLQGLKLVNFAATKEKFLTNDNPLFKYKQAEILVKTHVPLEYILNIDEF